MTRQTTLTLTSCLVLITFVVVGCTPFLRTSPPAALPTTPQPTASSPALAGPIDLSPPQPVSPSPGTSPPPAPLKASPTPLPLPTATATPLCIAAPLRPCTSALRRLTGGGCCTQPFWSPDSRRVLFIDRPNPDRPAAIWSVAVDQPDPQPEAFLDKVAYYSPDLRFMTYPEGQRIVIERREDGRRWTIDNGGRRITFSPDFKRIAWQISSNEGPFNERRSEIWLANLDGSGARRIATLQGGGLAGWLPDGRLRLTCQTSRDQQ